MTLLPLLWIACAPDCPEGEGLNSEGECRPYVVPGTDPTTDPTGTTAPITLEWGDPILAWGGDVTDGGKHVWEFVDVVALDDETALGSGQGGYALIDLDDGGFDYREDFIRTYDLAWDPELQQAYAGTRLEGVYVLDLSNREAPTESGYIYDWYGQHEDLAASAGRLLVAAPGEGAVLVDGETRGVLATIEADWAYAVGLHEDRAVVADANEVVLYDLTDETDPVELDRAALTATVRDIAFDGETIGVSLGGHGVGVVRVEEDALRVDAELPLPGTSYGVALDGDLLWASAWSEVALVWLGAGGPVVLGTEAITYNTLGIGAANGRAIAADWFGVAAFEHVEGFMGPELYAPPQIFAVGEGDAPAEATIEVTNYGAMTLALTAEAQDETASLSEDSWSLEPGDSARFTITGQEGRPLSTEVFLESNDPDELHSSVEVRTAEQSIGQPHEDFTVEGFVYPDTNLTPYSISEQTGRVTFLAYFALY